MGILKIVKVDEDDTVLFINDTISLSNGGKYELKDHRGFVIAYFDDEGNLYIKGEVRSIR